MDLKKLYIEKAVYPAMTLLQKNHVAAYTRELLATETMTAEDRAILLRQQMSELLLYCRENVPVYSDMTFTDLELRREPLDCLQAVDPIPLDEFLNQTRQYLCPDIDLTHLHHAVQRLGEEQSADLYYTQEQVARYEAARWRGLSWYGVTFGSPSVLLWDKPRDPYFLREEPYMRNRLSMSVCAITDRSIQPMLEEIDAFDPEYISGSANALAMLASGMERTGLRLQKPLKVVTVTQGVADGELRQRLRQVFDCPVAQNLGVRTEGILAYMCPEGHLHVTAENCFVEILDPQTWTPVAPGKPGLVAVTDLVDRTMPHLRVVLNFMAVMDEEPCPCGRTLPVLKHLRATAPME